MIRSGACLRVLLLSEREGALNPGSMLYIPDQAGIALGQSVRRVLILRFS